ncbi:hypothetical protein TRIATDRAFT_305832 [Trichoderma atroviride IMI 206040]|uniref:Oxidase ustYa n=1 Tax=Hypocrea atroviridis (strain ATCC 20476 / IMI 206040) TaxID=452589 RepID=G9NMF5_HYPAI|nr:uncharacterized protein TRIATDRAFT_305832 [Trichoderma atroviride IMI 206040]EHK48085.1 hypothetical protein TRIATDRAFT_305832 [Trichoderma atroviride IMI 206040]
MPSSFAKVESAAEMQDNFNEDEPSRGSNEFLIDHELKSRKGKSQRKSLFWTFSIILSAIGVVELIASATILLQLRSLHQPQIGSERNHIIPRFPTHQVLFQKDGSATTKSLSQEDRNETRENWLTYMPKGNGFLAINDFNKYDLPEPILYHGNNTYSIAVFHQLHCLYIVMDMYNSLLDPTSEYRTDPELSAFDSDAQDHVQHCFRYLRQSVTCCGDTTLEGHIPNSPLNGTDGTGATHVCKNFDAIRTWAEHRRVVDEKHP